MPQCLVPKGIYLCLYESTMKKKHVTFKQNNFSPKAEPFTEIRNTVLRILHFLCPFLCLPGLSCLMHPVGFSKGRYQQLGATILVPIASPTRWPQQLTQGSGVSVLPLKPHNDNSFLLMLVFRFQQLSFQGHIILISLSLTSFQLENSVFPPQRTMADTNNHPCKENINTQKRVPVYWLGCFQLLQQVMHSPNRV